MVACATFAAVMLSACSSGGASGGGDDTDFVMGDNGVSRVERGERQLAPDLSGRTVSEESLATSSFKGQVVVLNVWGSWCTPCRAEAKHFQTVYDDLNDQGVQFVGINVSDSQIAHARAFEKEFEITYPSLYDPSGKLLLRFKKGTLNPQAIPSTLILDRDGKVAARSLSALSEERLRDMIEPVLVEE
ncbi:TlpA family protein disulfide reductase [Streptomyces sp. NPDC091290]|uniref:TlpA family protein disulfide reductase n=1 Tax=Streptomyces sp. NPDC091290 TaxID=3365990 RepID=UPI00382FCE0E